MHSVDRHRHEAFGNLVVSASDGAAALIVVVTLRRELCLQTEAWRRSNCAASRSSIGSRTMTTQMVVDGDFSPTAIAAHLRQHPRGFGRRLSRERQRAKHTMRVRARTERERETAPRSQRGFACAGKERALLSREREKMWGGVATHTLSTHRRVALFFRASQV